MHYKMALDAPKVLLRKHFTNFHLEKSITRLDFFEQLLRKVRCSCTLVSNSDSLIYFRSHKN